MAVNEHDQPTLMHAEPVLAVTNVTETVRYWNEVLGFHSQWTWGNPPNHGGVSWHGVFVQFSLNPELAIKSAGQSLWIRVRELASLYAFHQKNGANIISTLQNKPWGMAEYALRDMNGYVLTFSAPSSDRTVKSEALPDTIRIISRPPTPAEYLRLIAAVGWGEFTSTERVESLLSPVIYAVVAEDTAKHEVVGCAFLIGDGVSLYYVKDVMVHPEWQNKKVGTALMKALTIWLDANAPENALVTLISGDNLAPFYQQFGFSPAFGMIRRIRKMNRQ
jgi:GNAT superfamily N-acetyltransferase/uncharacterized glyoxalase superfamily protein PhnB